MRKPLSRFLGALVIGLLAGGCVTTDQIKPPVVAAPVATMTATDAGIDASATVGVQWYAVDADPTVTIHADDANVHLTLLLPLDVNGLQASATLDVVGDLDLGTTEARACVDAPGLTAAPVCKETEGWGKPAPPVDAPVDAVGVPEVPEVPE